MSAFAASVLSSLALAGCGPPTEVNGGSNTEDIMGLDDVTRESQEALDAARQKFEQERAEFSTEFRTYLDELDMRVAALREKLVSRISESDEPTAEGWRATLSDLDARKTDIEDQFNTLNQTSSETLDDFRTSLARAKESLAKAVYRAEQDFERVDETTREELPEPAE
jgi:uncharacterized protein YPO0396